MEKIKEKFGNLKKLLYYVLENYPETRNSDNKLFIQAYRELGATSLNDLEDGQLNISSIYRVRQEIQNKEGKFLPNDEVRHYRRTREKAIRQYYKKAN
ncbi:hypothetical protein MUN88_17185 [Gracilibacillus caseinilyticus]|uniref:Uncharacterized protein n=1 Tax=Gracilibacillus caseinilyticus TaxID=2932256 RepID=A0ABY4ETM0_9BACI|nr:hypothetical protein [Gracilibacillus caseinilyticus]UOQ47766.1 hypothetical protein MUN88_17185 [Gracilibacillus caseinilyticus]